MPRAERQPTGLRGLSQILLTAGLVLVVLAALGALLVALDGGANTGAVSVPRINKELATQIHLQKLADGRDFQVRVGCTANPSDGLRLSCHVEVADGATAIDSFNEEVTCHPPGGNLPRCLTDRGDALE